MQYECVLLIGRENIRIYLVAKTTYTYILHTYTCMNWNDRCLAVLSDSNWSKWYNLQNAIRNFWKECTITNEQMYASHSIMISHNVVLLIRLLLIKYANASSSRSKKWNYVVWSREFFPWGHVTINYVRSQKLPATDWNRMKWKEFSMRWTMNWHCWIHFAAQNWSAERDSPNRNGN